MRVIREMRQHDGVDRGGCLAVGNFDGVHRGHKVLIDEVISRARQDRAPAGVMVFEPHPREFFQPTDVHFRLTPLAEKVRLFGLLGLDFAAVLDFDAQLATLTADDFICQKLVHWLGVRHVVVGFDFRFGKDRSGDAETLEAAGLRHGFTVRVVTPQGEGEHVFSSTRIRTFLARGEVRQAANLLGHWWRVAGQVVTGSKLGSELGFPTANIEMPSATEFAHGIYAVWIFVGGQRFAGAAYYGGRPTVDGGQPGMEAYLFDYEGDLYGREIAIEFVDHIRKDEQFGSLDELKAQMARDCEYARAMLDSAGPAPKNLSPVLPAGQI